MSKKLLFGLLLIVVAALVVAPVAAQDRIVVNWFVGLGTGTNEAQIEAQNAVVEAFNASQDEIELQITIAASNQVAPDTLSTLIAGGTPPDIVGPVGFDGANSFPNQWLDLQPLIDAAGYDLSVLPQGLVDLYSTPDGLVGIPFAVFPAMTFYNADLFDEADLPYPPAEFDAPYVLDGEEMPWDWNTLAEISQILTVDSNGNDASMDEFDPSTIEQFGFVQQWSTQRADFSTFGGAYFYEDGTVTIPENWREQAQWQYDALWTWHITPTSTYEASQLFQPSAFASGRVAMARVQLWYTCCLGDLQDRWDLGVIPSYNGVYSAPVDADTYRIMKTTENPEAAFTVLQYLLGDAALELLQAYGAFPARPDLQDQFITALSERYPSVENWSVVPASLNYAAVPNHEYDYPNYAVGKQRFADFRTLLFGDTGADIDLTAELDRLQADLQAIVDEAGS